MSEKDVSNHTLACINLIEGILWHRLRENGNMITNPYASGMIARYGCVSESLKGQVESILKSSPFTSFSKLKLYSNLKSPEFWGWYDECMDGDGPITYNFGYICDPVEYSLYMTFYTLISKTYADMSGIYVEGLETLAASQLDVTLDSMYEELHDEETNLTNQDFQSAINSCILLPLSHVNLYSGMARGAEFFMDKNYSTVERRLCLGI